MTSTAPGAHPPPEEVDALLDPSGGDVQVGAHVAVCDRCAQVRADLREVRALLGAQAGTVPPEPPDLGARIAAALAAEPPLGAGAGSTTSRPSTSTSTVVRLDERRPRRTWVTVLAAAASVAVIGAGGAVLLGQITGGAADSSAGAAAELPALATAESSDRAAEDDGGGAEGAPAAPQTAAPGAPSVQGTPPEPADAASPERLRTSGTDYTRAGLATQAQRLLAEVGAAGPQVSTDAGDLLGPDQGYDVADGATRGACLVAVGRPGAQPVVTDLASYEGRRAAVLVLPARDGYEVVVVPGGCGAGQDRVLASTRLD